MFETVIASLFMLTGGLLANRYKVLILVPATFAGCLLIALGGALLGANGPTVLITMAIGASALQFGYLIGVVARYRVFGTLFARKPIVLNRRPAV
jgi:hypothetical protein